MASEFAAAQYYSERGHEILWPSSGSSSYDLVIDDGKVMRRVQVKRAYWKSYKGGRNTYLVAGVSRSGKTYTEDDCDVFFVHHEEGAWEIPVTLASNRTEFFLMSKSDKPLTTRRGGVDYETMRVR